jgi:polyhydroxybutyrate depolymerase
MDLIDKDRARSGQMRRLASVPACGLTLAIRAPILVAMILGLRDRHGWMRAIALAALAALLAGCGGGSGDGAPAPDPVASWSRDNPVPGYTDRAYDLYVPKSTVGVPAAAVVVLHGGGGTAFGAEQMSCPTGDIAEAGCLHRLGESARFVTVYPRGTAPPGGGDQLRTWNAGGGVAGYDCVSGLACSSNVDDIAYFTALLDALAARVAIDPDRIYVTGLSNGAAMTHRLACSLASRIAAVAAVSGAGQMDIAPGCAPARRVPLLQVHGTADPCWTYVASDAACLSSTGIKIGVEASLARWATRNGCSATTTSTALPDAAADGTTTTRVAWTDCAAAVELLRIQGGGHAWPNGYQYLPEAKVGRVPRDFGSEQIWDFFKAHPRTAAR